MSSAQVPAGSSALLEWLRSSGGGLHETAEIRAGSGQGVYAKEAIPADARLVSCPFSLAVASKLASDAICALLDVTAADLVWPAETSRAGEEWNDRMLIGAYLALHWVYLQDKGCDVEQLPAPLQHAVYVRSLPGDDELHTPLFFSEDERELLKGTNLYGATQDREREWREEAETVRSALKQDGLTWERYRRTSTYLSSRAFPSKLLSLPPSGSSKTSAPPAVEEEESHPVLLPGLDMFNHSRGQPIVWLSSELDTASGPIPAVSLVSTAAQPADAQLFNNYGPKSNEELLLGYGFALEDNPDDIVALKLGSAGLTPKVQQALKTKDLQADKRFLLKRDGKLDPDLLAVLRVLITKGEEDDEDPDSEDEHALHEQEERGMQLELDVLSTLGQMLDDKLDKLERAVREGNVRKEVARMCSIYRQGQVDVLNTTLEVLSARIDRIEGMLDQGLGGCACCS